MPSTRQQILSRELVTEAFRSVKVSKTDGFLYVMFPKTEASMRLCKHLWNEHCSGLVPYFQPFDKGLELGFNSVLVGSNWEKEPEMKPLIDKLKQLESQAQRQP